MHRKTPFQRVSAPLLVSAAAGSGKTAVLVERVVSRILDPDAPIGADRILVVTFTRAAAAEMRARLEQRLEQEREKNPQSLFLQRQQILLTRAHIGTIDSFCQELVREHFSELGFPADFRVADDSERKILEQAALTEVLERHYGAKDQAFYALLGCFALGRDDRALSGMLLSLYAFTRSHPFPKRWLQEKARLYAEGDPDKTPWGKEVRAYAEEAVAYCIEQMREAVRIAQEDAGLREKCAPFLEAEAAQLQSVEKALSEHTPWDGIGAWLDNVVFDRLPTPRGYKEHPGKAAISTRARRRQEDHKGAAEIFRETGCRVRRGDRKAAPARRDAVFLSGGIYRNLSGKESGAQARRF